METKMKSKKQLSPSQGESKGFTSENSPLEGSKGGVEVFYPISQKELDHLLTVAQETNRYDVGLVHAHILKRGRVKLIDE